MSSHSLQFQGYIRDVIHGDIPYTSYEKKVIDHPLFQRLRKIKQLGFLYYIFPNADHKRFSHSIGTMYVANQILMSIIENQKNILNFTIAKNKNIFHQTDKVLSKIQEKEQVQILRLAALLHDIGHFPFSHSSENFIEYNHIKKIINKNIPSWLVSAIDKNNLRHEAISILMIYFVLSEIDLDTFQSEPQNQKKISKEKIVREVISLIHSKVSLPKNSILTNHSQKLFTQIISGEIDADRIDYLLRDSYFSGASYGNFDKEYLLKNLCFFIEDGQCILSLKQNGINAFEHYLFCRYQMYLQVYTHKKNTFFEAILQELKKIMILELEIDHKTFLNFYDDRFFDSLKLKKEFENQDYYKNLAKQYIKLLSNNRKTWDIAIDLDPVLSENVKTLQKGLSQLEKKKEFKDSFCVFESSRSLTKLSYENQKNQANQKNFFVLIRKGEREEMIKKNIIECSHLIKSFKKKTTIINIFVKPEKKNLIKKEIFKK